MRAGAAGAGVLDRPRGWPRGWASRGACGRRGAGGSAARGRGRAGAVSGLGPRAGQGCAEGEGASVVARQTRGSHAGAGGRREGGGAAWGWGGAAWGEGGWGGWGTCASVLTSGCGVLRRPLPHCLRSNGTIASLRSVCCGCAAAVHGFRLLRLSGQMEVECAHRRTWLSVRNDNVRAAHGGSDVGQGIILGIHIPRSSKSVSISE